ncbi:SDR family NAD(P)-dependent oxidoreductase [Lacrimispora brassicae]
MNHKRTIVITGANSGLGYLCAENIAQKSHDYAIVLACRNGEKAEKAKNQLIENTGNPNIYSMVLDVASMESVREFAQQFKNRNFSPLYGIICNAGINGMHTGITCDGFDIVFQTNHLGHFLLTHLMLPYMSQDGRIVIVSSDMHNPPGGELVWQGTDALAYPEDKTAFNRYSFSKLCNLYFTYELDKKLKEASSGITVNAFNPGLMTDTNFAPKARFTEDFLNSVSDRIGSLERSAMAMSEMMTESQYQQVTGKYFDRGVERKSSPLSYNTENTSELWNKSIQYTKLAQSETLSGLI